MAKFEKGKSGNPNGRPKGSTDTKKAYIRDWVIALIGSNGKRLEQEFSKLPRKEQWRVITNLMPYVLPRQQEQIVDGTMEVKTPDPVVLRFVASKEELEKVQNEIPDIQENK